MINKYVLPTVKMLLEDSRHSILKQSTHDLVKELYELMGDTLFSSLPGVSSQLTLILQDMMTF